MIISCLLQIVMCVVNAVILLLGGVVLFVGVMLKIGSNLLGEIPEVQPLVTVSSLLIAIGTFVTIVAFLGCCGAMCKNKLMLLLFFIIVLVVFLAEVSITVFVMVKHPSLDKVLEMVYSASAQHGSDLRNVVNMVKEHSLLRVLVLCIAVLEVGAMIASMFLYKS